MNNGKRKLRLPKTRLGQVLFSVAVTVVVGLVYFYMALPPINLRSGEFYAFVFLLCLVYIVTGLFTTVQEADEQVVRTPQRRLMDAIDFVKKNCLPVGILLALVILTAVIGQIISLPIFRAASYRELLDVQNGSFSEDVAQISLDEIPTLDRTSANYLGDRQMGTLSDMVSQF